VKLSRVGSQQHRQKQMLAYGMEVTWKDPIVDWESMGSTLATAIRHPKGYPLGVLQLLNKRSRRGRACAFTDHDIRLAERLVLEVIGPKLHSLAMPTRSPSIDTCMDWGAELSRLPRTETSQLLDHAASLLQQAMPESQGRKLYMACMLSRANHEFSTLAMRGRLKRHLCEESNYDLDQTITARAIQEPESSGHGDLPFRT